MAESDSVLKTAYRTHTCGQLRAADVGSPVRMAGWVQRRRDQGGIVFFDLRDRYGLTQISVDVAKDPEAHAIACTVKPEYSVQVEGEVGARPESARNPRMETGDVEVRARRIEVLSTSPTPPFEIAGVGEEVSDEIRLRHRPLDLRRAPMRDNLLRRHRMVSWIRRFYEDLGFVEIETPILAKATPEGARDYLVPSRLYHGRFYALPQAPQIYKQILMCSGFDRYYQIARCFRDEDLRADRQPEFTQLDIEMSFVQPEDVLGPIERLITGLVREVAKHPCELALPWPRIPYDEALRRFGTDKPDLRYGMEIVDVGEAVREAPFQVFRNALEGGGAVRGVRVEGGADVSRKQIEEWQKEAASFGAKGLAWMKLGPEGASGPLSKFLDAGQLAPPFGAQAGDLLLFVADVDPGVVAWSLGAVRVAVARDRGLVPENSFAACFVVDFPLFLPGDEPGSWTPAHHAFTMPHPEDLERLESEPGKVRALAYDPVLNGVELGSGSVRIHRREIQQRVFRVMRIPDDEAQQRFGFLLDVLRYGAPPHGGIALGLDRVAMLLCGESTIREVIAFPKTTRAVDLMSDSPSPVEPRQLDELGLSIGAGGGAQAGQAASGGPS